MRNFDVATLLPLQLLVPGSSVTRLTTARLNGAFCCREAWQISHSLSIAATCYLDTKYHVNRPISFEHTTSNKNYAHLVYFAACSGNPLQTFRETYQSQVFLDSWSQKMGLTCSETSERNYHYTLRNGPEECSSQLLGGGSLKTGI